MNPDNYTSCLNSFFCIVHLVWMRTQAPNIHVHPPHPPFPRPPPQIIAWHFGANWGSDVRWQSAIRIQHGRRFLSRVFVAARSSRLSGVCGIQVCLNLYFPMFSYDFRIFSYYNILNIRKQLEEITNFQKGLTPPPLWSLLKGLPGRVTVLSLFRMICCTP